MTRRAAEDEVADGALEIARLVGHRVDDVVAALDHAPEEGRAVDRDRSDWRHILVVATGEPGDQAGDVDVSEDHVGGPEVGADHGADGLRKLALVRRSGNTHLQEVEGLEAGALGLRLRKVVRVGEGEADVRRDVLQQLHMPLIEGVLRIRLDRQHGGDLITADHGHPDERPRHAAVVGRGAGHEYRGPLGDRPDLALQLLALEGAGPGRAADQHRLAGLVCLARRAGDCERDRRDDLLYPGHVLVALGDGTVGRVCDRGEDEAVECEVGGQLLAQGAHDRPAIQARREAPPDRVDDLEPPAVVLDRLIAARVAQRQRDLVRDELEEGRGGILVGVGPRAADAQGPAGHAALLERYPQRRMRLVYDHRLVAAHHLARTGAQG